MYFRLLCVLALSRCVVAVAIPPDDKQPEWRKFFSHFKPDAVVVTANFSEENTTSDAHKRNIRLDSLRPDEDKLELFHPKYEVFEPAVIEDQGKKIALKNISLSSYVPSLPNPFAKLPLGAWSKKKIVTTTVVVQKTQYRTVYPSCLILQNVQSVCDDKQVITTAPPFRPKPTAGIWRTDTYAAIPNPESDLLMDEFAPTSATMIRATETVRLDDTQNNSSTFVFTSRLDNDAAGEVEPSVVSTPKLNDTVLSVDEDSAERALIDSLIVSNLEIVTASSTAYKTVDLIDYQHMATIKIEKCLPRDLITSRLPLCNHVVLLGRNENEKSDDANRVLPASENSRISEPNQSDANNTNIPSTDTRNSTQEAKEVLVGIEPVVAFGQHALNSVRQRIRHFAYEDIIKRVFGIRINAPLSPFVSYPKSNDLDADQTIAVETYEQVPALTLVY